MSQPLFTDDERREMGRRTLDRVLDAIDAGDRDKAKQLATRMYNEFLGMHDLYRNWTTALLSGIGRRFGDAALQELMDEGVKAWWQPIIEKMPPATPDTLAQRVKMFAAGLRGHLQPMQIDEDDEKIVIRMTPCGSGGRLVLEGRYEGKGAFMKIAAPQRMTYGRADFPVYCAHEASMELADIEANGVPFVVVEPAEKLGREHCAFVIYKDPAKVPARYWERFGLKKPD